MNTLATLYAHLTPRTRALAIWSPLCLTAAIVLGQNLGVVNGGTILSLALFGATGYKAVTGLID
jgi:hypothetical protein